MTRIRSLHIQSVPVQSSSPRRVVSRHDVEVVGRRAHAAEGRGEHVALADDRAAANVARGRRTEVAEGHLERLEVNKAGSNRSPHIRHRRNDNIIATSTSNA